MNLLDFLGIVSILGSWVALGFATSTPLEMKVVIVVAELAVATVLYLDNKS